ncbi:MAG: Stp1/IreP family PP2C-type Ser/Thr phosphatase [Planctomycetota bacterium]|nr:Stp1/IreP family PP2C-type Ser/Thr phosphatase [Planctomycetota bacterium]
MSEKLQNASEVTEPPEIAVRPAGPFRWAAETDPGRIRPENEDTFFTDTETALFVVSDGMGGHRGGALASGIISEDLPVIIENALDRLKVGTTRMVRSLLEKAIAEQSRQLQLEGTSEAGYEDMGATLVIALLRKKRCFVANVGDSRAYRLRAGRFTQLTRDHSVVSELIERGRITPDEALDHAASGQLTRYIGMEENVRSHVRSFALKKNDRILLCTDGLTDMVSDRDIADILKAEADPQSACKSLVAAANHAGGHDNITTLLIDWVGLR